MIVSTSVEIPCHVSSQTHVLISIYVYPYEMIRDKYSSLEKHLNEFGALDLTHENTQEEMH